MIATSFVLLCFASIACEALVIRSPASIAGTYLHETGTSLVSCWRRRRSVPLRLRLVSFHHLISRFIRRVPFCLKYTANFGPAAGTYSVSGFAVLSDPENACSSLRAENASAPSRYAGAVVFALRGNCSFGVKISNIQAAGAIAAVVGNNDFDSDALFAYALASRIFSVHSVYAPLALSLLTLGPHILRDHRSHFDAVFLFYPFI